MKEALNFYLGLSVKTKLALLVGCFSLWLVVIGFIGLMSNKIVSEGIGEVHDILRQVIRADAIKNDMLILRLDLVHGLTFTDSDKFESAMRDAHRRIESIEGVIGIFSSMPLDQNEKAILEELKSSFSEFKVAALKLEEMERVAFPEARTEAAEFAAGEFADLYAEASDYSNDLVDSLEKHALREKNYDIDRSERMGLIMGGALAAAVALGIFFGWVIVRSILSPLRRTLEVVEAIQEGDLSGTTGVHQNDDIGRLAAGIDEMVFQISSVVSNISSHAKEVQVSSVKLLDASAKIASGVEEVVAQSVTVATASEEMSSTAQNIAESCHVAATGAKQAEREASEGARIVEETILSMRAIASRVGETASVVQELGRRSDQIGDIVGTIEDIADQTNLLALNAAIEAARAGEQGRGFAVVADEVRALAERTAKATKEVARIIRAIQADTGAVVEGMEGSVRQVEEGTLAAGRAESALRDIINHIDVLTGQISQVAAASEEQSATTHEISGNIHQISEITGEASRQVNGNVVAAEGLANLAKQMMAAIQRFKLNGETNV